jgi:hypothetical protein
VQSRRLWPANGRQPSPACSTRGGIGRLCCDGIRLVAKPQRKPQTFLRLLHPRLPAPPADTRATPRGRQFIALASIAIRPLASGQRRTVTGQLTSNPHPTSRIITGCPCGGTPRSRIHRQLRSPAAFLGLRACSLKAIYSAHPKWPRGPQCRSSWPEGVRGVSFGGTRCSWSRSAGPSLLGRYPDASEWTFHAARTQRGGEASP